MLNIIRSKEMNHCLVCIKSLMMLFLVASCKLKTDETSKEMEKHLHEIEEALVLNRQSDLDYLKRLQMIRNRIVERQSQVKYPIMFFDNAQVDSTYHAYWTMASYNPKSLPIAYIEIQNEGMARDTLKFDLECGCFPVNIDNFKKGENKYYGYVFDEEVEYIFEGIFEGY